MASISVYIHFLADKQYRYFTELQMVWSSKILTELCMIETPSSYLSLIWKKKEKVGLKCLIEEQVRLKMTEELLNSFWHDLNNGRKLQGHMQWS